MISNKLNSIRSIISNNISSFKLYSPITIRNNKLINNRLFNSSLITTHSTSTSTSTSTTTSTSKINKISYFNNNGRSINNSSIKLNNNNTNHNILNTRYFTTTTTPSTKISDNNIRENFNSFIYIKRIVNGNVDFDLPSTIKQIRYYQKLVIEKALGDNGSNIDRYEYIIMYWRMAEFISDLLNKINNDKTVVVYNNISMEEVEQVWKFMNIGPNLIPDRLDEIVAYLGYSTVKEFNYINIKLVQLAVKECKLLSEKDRQKLIECRGSKFFNVLTGIAFINGLWQEGIYLNSLYGDCGAFQKYSWHHNLNVLDDGTIYPEEYDRIIEIIRVSNLQTQNYIPSEYLFDYNCYQPPTDHSLNSSYEIKSFGNKDSKMIGVENQTIEFEQEYHHDNNGLSASEIVELSYGKYNKQNGYYEQETSDSIVLIISRVVNMVVKFNDETLYYTGVMNHDFTKCVLIGSEKGITSFIACDVKKSRIGDCEYSIELEGTQTIELHYNKSIYKFKSFLRVNLETDKSSSIGRFKPVNL